MIRVFLTLILLLSSTPVFAVTNFVVVVNSASEDYNTLTLAEAALDNATDLTDGTVKCGSWDAQSGTIADAAAVTWDAGVSSGTLIHMTDLGATGQYLVDVAAGTIDDNDIISDGTNTITVNGATDSCIIEIDLYDDQGDLDDQLTVDGFTTDATNYVLITAPTGERHNGTAASGAEIANTADAVTLALSDNNTIFEWIVLKTNYVGTANRSFSTMNNDGTIIRNCIFHDSNDSGAAIILRTILMNNIDSNVQNNIIYEITDSPECMEMNNSSGDVVTVDNNTFYNCGSTLGIDLNGANGTSTVRNNLSFSNGTDYDTGFDVFTTNGASDTTGDPVGLDSLTASTEFTNLTAGSEDFHIKTGAVSIDAGTDLGTTNQVDIDIDGVARSGTWDVGADEFVSAVSTIITTIYGATLYGATIY